MVPESTDEEEDWTKYADAGYASEYDPWSDLVELEEEEEEIEFEDDFEDFDEDERRERDVPRCPSPKGIAYVIEIGTCDACLGRISGTRIAGDPLHIAGARVRTEAIQRDSDLTVNEDAEYCPFCENLFVDIDLIVRRILRSVEGIEFNKAQLGIHFSKEHVAAEESIRTSLAATGSRPLKASLTESIQAAVKEELPNIKWVKEKPEIMLLLDTLTLGVNVDIRAIFIYGRYRKLSREIPQTRWPCRSCRGRGEDCEACEGTGQQYLHSIQSLICTPLVEVLSATGDAFHGMGREDIDVRCLGQGRPFVAELKRPVIRTLDFEKITASINKAAKDFIEVDNLRFSNKAEVARIKETKAEKSYTICFNCKHGFSDAEVEARILTLDGKVLEQQTPQRVAHRRADKIRKRKIASLDNVSVDGDEVQFRVRCESGTYVKELVHSDEGRTTPSVAGVLEAECEVLWLDVEDIHAD
ncbi:MAG: tRNA pseudouridine(54/55) synthase Pus10 [Candidatus Thermoplasmatota archaeon]|nr:tRNA pseudouridine(54/55) synthase Pus10 [Candidatus Thermoplasmatota archaeon]